MRDYGKVSPQFWIGKTGKALRGNAEAQLLALYLMTSPHANMIGVYHCPIAYMAHETGMTIEGASKALRCLIEADFCTFDADDEYVFVHQFAAHQVGESLLASDKRCKGVENELAKVPKNQCWQAFRARYAEPYNLPLPAINTSPLQAPKKPLASQKQKQEQKQEQNSPSLRSGESASSDAPPDDPEKPKTRKAQTLTAYLAECKAARAKPVPDDHAIRRWAEDAGIVPEMLQIAWVKFRERYTDGEKGKGKRYKDWPGHFATAVKDNWFKLWFADDDGIKWSTQGLTCKTVLDAQMKQQEAAHAA